MRVFVPEQTVKVNGRAATIISVHRISLIICYTDTTDTATVRKSKVDAEVQQ